MAAHQQAYPEDLARIERGDLMLVRERFLNSNNATLVIAGGVDRAKAMRTLKQLFGPWRKSEQIAPSTFQEAKAPDPRPY
jgi:predicted Zn-dependent peptidase